MRSLICLLLQLGNISSQCTPSILLLLVSVYLKRTFPSIVLEYSSSTAAVDGGGGWYLNALLPNAKKSKDGSYCCSHCHRLSGVGKCEDYWEEAEGLPIDRSLEQPRKGKWDWRGMKLHLSAAPGRGASDSFVNCVYIIHDTQIWGKVELLLDRKSPSDSVSVAIVMVIERSPFI